MDLHYQGRTFARQDWSETALRQLLEPESGLRYAVARIGDAPVGIACFALFRHDLFHPRSLFLKDLFVRDEARGHGTGEALVRFLAGLAVKHGVDRIDLTVDAPNEGAARFYARLSGAPVTDKIAYRFDNRSLTALAGSQGEER